MGVPAFLSARRPPPPRGLRDILMAEARDGGVAAGLLGQAMAELELARSSPGRVRESAWHLLAADALLTYACEAALEGSNPPGAFEEILRKAATGEA